MRFFLIFSALVLLINPVFAYDYPVTIQSYLEINQKVNYETSSKNWARLPFKNGVTFTKHMTVGSGGFSEFKFGKKYYDTNTTLEFFEGNKLIGYNQHLLKFFELGFDGNKITTRELKPSEVHDLFPNTEIVKISDFKKDKITLKKPFGKSRTFLLLNDTNRDFYKYNYENHGNGTELIKSIIDIEKPKKIVFSHFGSREPEFPELTIQIKNSIFKK